MLTHDEIQTFLEDTFPPAPPDRGTRLVARWEDSATALPPARARLFIPDLHLLRTVDETYYPNTGFRLETELLRFLRALAAFKQTHPGELEVLQLGDVFDLWRARKGSPKQKADSIAADHAELVARLRFGPPYGVRADLVAGNHDYDLHRLVEWDAPRFWFLNGAASGQTDVLAIHGDQFDFIEVFAPDAIQAAIVRLARFASAGKHELDHEQMIDVLALNDTIPRTDSPIGTAMAELEASSMAPPPTGSTAVNVVQWSPTAGGAGRYFEPAQRLCRKLVERGRDIRLVVCGHSHDARIVVGDRGDGVQLGLMDCGAWFGRCRFHDSAWRPSAQIGVLVGNDARIYQLL